MKIVPNCFLRSWSRASGAGDFSTDSTEESALVSTSRPSIGPGGEPSLSFVGFGGTATRIATARIFCMSAAIRGRAFWILFLGKLVRATLLVLWRRVGVRFV